MVEPTFHRLKEYVPMRRLLIGGSTLFLLLALSPRVEAG